MKKYKPVNWEIEHPCPQCGAPVILGETDRLLSCSYCRTRLYLTPRDYFRYYLPPADRFSADAIFVPYWRLKGMVFLCLAEGVRHRIIDVSSRASHHPFLPLSLGLRPQALKLKFVSPEMEAKFINPGTPLEKVIENAGALSDPLDGDDGDSPVHPGSAAHKVFIGETVSLIYSPIFVRAGRAHDAILGKGFARIPKDFPEDLTPAEQQRDWQAKFIPTLCPYCGWDLLGEKESVVLFCKNCHSAWNPSQTGFEKLDVGTIPGGGERAVYLPFWRMNVLMEGAEFESSPDFKRLTDATRVMKEGEKGPNQDFYFWSPAFKVPPQVFLRLALGMTLSHPREEVEGPPPGPSLHPVTLPASEAVETIKLTMAHSATNKRAALPGLNKLRIHLNESLLVFLPFILQGIDFIQIHTKLCIPRSSLELGRVL